MKQQVLIVALAIIFTACLTTPALSDEQEIRSPSNKERAALFEAAAEGNRRRLTTREAVRLALQRRGWWSDKWESVKSGFKKIGNKIETGWEKFKNGTKAAWKTFKEHAGRDASNDNTIMAERSSVDSSATKKRDNPQTKQATAGKRIVKAGSFWENASGNLNKGWINKGPILS